MDFSAEMMSFHGLLPEIAENETRIVTVTDEQSGIKPGQYVFHELYCTDRKCDCRRAMIQVTDVGGH